MILIDSTCWVQAIRRNGDETIKQRVKEIMRRGEAAWCPMVRLELWSGAGSDKDRALLVDMERTVHELAIDDMVWQEACDLAGKCRRKGKPVPATDILIFACAKRHKVSLEHADNHYEILKGL